MNSNDEIRDDELQSSKCTCKYPDIPELIGEMIRLNYDRGLTAFVVGDRPRRYYPNAISLNEWGTNVNPQAVEDNADGLVSRDEYLGVYYPGSQVTT